MTEKRKPVVLTIDDEQPVRQRFKNYIEDCDYKVLEAEKEMTLPWHE